MADKPTCGVCKRPTDNPSRIRLAADDIDSVNERDQPVGKAPGLYSVCQACYDIYRPVVASRLGKDPATAAGNDLT
jgi:hypothetical protein